MHSRNLQDINIDSVEGRLFMAALAKLTTESQTGKTPDEVIEQCTVLANEMYKELPPLDEGIIENKSFSKELERLINIFSKDGDSNTPDFILREYLSTCLNAFTLATQRRDNWYGGRQCISGEKKKWDVPEIEL